MKKWKLLSGLAGLGLAGNIYAQGDTSNEFKDEDVKPNTEKAQDKEPVKKVAQNNVTTEVEAKEEIRNPVAPKDWKVDIKKDTEFSNKDVNGDNIADIVIKYDGMALTLDGKTNKLSTEGAGMAITRQVEYKGGITTAILAQIANQKEKQGFYIRDGKLTVAKEMYAEKDFDRKAMYSQGLGIAPGKNVIFTRPGAKNVGNFAEPAPKVDRLTARLESLSKYMEEAQKDGFSSEEKHYLFEQMASVDNEIKAKSSKKLKPVGLVKTDDFKKEYGPVLEKNAPALWEKMKDLDHILTPQFKQTKNYWEDNLFGESVSIADGQFQGDISMRDELIKLNAAMFIYDRSGVVVDKNALTVDSEDHGLVHVADKEYNELSALKKDGVKLFYGGTQRIQWLKDDSMTWLGLMLNKDGDLVSTLPDQQAGIYSTIAKSIETGKAQKFTKEGDKSSFDFGNFFGNLFNFGKLKGDVETNQFINPRDKDRHSVKANIGYTQSPTTKRENSEEVKDGYVETASAMIRSKALPQLFGASVGAGLEMLINHDGHTKYKGNITQKFNKNRVYGILDVAKQLNSEFGELLFTGTYKFGLNESKEVDYLNVNKEVDSNFDSNVVNLSAQAKGNSSQWNYAVNAEAEIARKTADKKTKYMNGEIPSTEYTRNDSVSLDGRAFPKQGRYKGLENGFSASVEHTKYEKQNKGKDAVDANELIFDLGAAQKYGTIIIEEKIGRNMDSGQEFLNLRGMFYSTDGKYGIDFNAKFGLGGSKKDKKDQKFELSLGAFHNF